MNGIIGSIERIVESQIESNKSNGNSVVTSQFKWRNFSLSEIQNNAGFFIPGKKFYENDDYAICLTGEPFITQSDPPSPSSEITKTALEIIEIYRTKGLEFLHDLDGAFVIVLLDKIKKKIFIARDRAGIEPLYYSTDTNQFLFSSFLKPIHKILKSEIDYKNLYTYLRLGSFFRDQTPYMGIKELLAGYYLEIDTEFLNFEINKWWDIRQFYTTKFHDSFETSLKKTEKSLNTAIKSLLNRSDTEIGSFLSGGIDSGLVTAVASNYQPGVKTFTISFGGEYDESPLAKMVADKYKTTHREIRLSFDSLNNDVEGILCNYGEPFFDSSAIPSYYVSKAAKEFVPAILNGDGADELFGGYRKYIPFSKFDFFKSGSLAKTLANKVQKILPPGNQKKSLYNYFYRLIDFSSKSGAGVYLSSGVDIFEGFTQYFINQSLDYFDPVEEYILGIDTTSISGLKKLMYLDFDIGLFDDMAVKMSIATKANNLTGYSPFLSKSFTEYIPGLPDNYKIRGKTTKFLLRKLAGKYLPAELINQPKRGFEVPLKKWVNSELKEIIESYLHSANPLFENLVEKKFIENLIAHKINISEEKRAKILWTLFSLEVWYQKVYKSRS